MTLNYYHRFLYYQKYHPLNIFCNLQQSCNLWLHHVLFQRTRSVSILHLNVDRHCCSSCCRCALTLAWVSICGFCSTSRCHVSLIALFVRSRSLRAGLSAGRAPCCRLQASLQMADVSRRSGGVTKVLLEQSSVVNISPVDFVRLLAASLPAGYPPPLASCWQPRGSRCTTWCTCTWS